MSGFDWVAGLKALGVSALGVASVLAIAALLILLYREVYFRGKGKDDL